MYTQQYCTVQYMYNEPYRPTGSLSDSNPRLLPCRITRTVHQYFHRITNFPQHQQKRGETCLHSWNCWTTTKEERAWGHILGLRFDKNLSFANCYFLFPRTWKVHVKGKIRFQTTKKFHKTWPDSED